MANPTLQQILSAPGTDAEKEEAIRHFYPEAAKQFDSAPVASPDPRLELAMSGPAGRAGAQVLRPLNGKAIMDAAVDAGNFTSAIPGAVASVYKDYGVGALKGLGGMADSAIKAAGLPRSDYADAALAPSNPVQAVGGGAAQTGAGILATAATGVLGKGAGLLSKAARAAFTPAGSGAIAGATDLAQGKDLRTAATDAVLTGVGVKGLTGVMGTIGKLRAFKGMIQKAQAISEAEALLASNELKGAERQVLEKELAAAKQTAAEVKPIPPSKSPVRPADPEIPEIKGDVVEAKPAFKGQQSAKGATADRFKDIRDRTVKGWMEAGKSDAFIRQALKDRLKLSDDVIDATIRAVGGKS